MIAVSLLKSVPDIAKIYAFFCVEVSSGTAALVLCFHIPWTLAVLLCDFEWLLFQGGHKLFVSLNLTTCAHLRLYWHAFLIIL